MISAIVWNQPVNAGSYPKYKTTATLRMLCAIVSGQNFKHKGPEINELKQWNPPLNIHIFFVRNVHHVIHGKTTDNCPFPNAKPGICPATARHIFSYSIKIALLYYDMYWVQTVRKPKRQCCGQIFSFFSLLCSTWKIENENVKDKEKDGRDKNGEWNGKCRLRWQIARDHSFDTDIEWKK